MAQILEEKSTNKNKQTYERSYWLTFVFLILVAIDQLSKFYAEDVFKNSAFAFSLPLPVWLIYIIYGFVCCGMLYYYARQLKKLLFFQHLAWVLIFAGGLSNIGERIILGYVRDWIYILTGVFNLADIFIILGIIILLFYKSDNYIDKIEQDLKD